MTHSPPQNLEELIRHSGENWLIDWFSPKDRAIPYLKNLLSQADTRLRGPSPGPSQSIDEQSLIAEFLRSPHKVQAFLQAIGETRSPDMLAMAWKVLQGCEVAQVELTYKIQKSFRMQIILRMPDGAQETYESHDIDDAAILRHLGILKMNDHPVFDGFYALRR